MNPAQMNIGRFYGKVVDENTGKGVPYASVQLWGMKFDSTSKSMKEAILAGQLTEENGDFSLENLPVRGEFTLKINYLGYANYEQKLSFQLKGAMQNRQNQGAMAAAVDKDLGNIKLSVSSEILKEVTIEGNTGQVTLAMDRKVYKVDKDGIAAGGTAEDAMKNIPSLNVDIDGNVTMRNASPQIFVDGRPTNLSLDQIPADAIENIEVITNPSAKFDASGGGAGILNIVLKKERRIGYNGSVRAGVDMRGRFNLGGDINMREGKFNAFINGNLNQRKSISTGQTERFNLTTPVGTNVFQQDDAMNTGYFAMGRAGVDWFISNRNTLTIAGNFTGGGFDSENELNIRTDTIINELVGSSNAFRKTINERMFRNYGAQILFKHIYPKEGKEWTADFNLNGSNSENQGDFTTTYTDRPLNSTQRQIGTGANQFYTFQTDFVEPFANGAKIEVGARAALRNYQSDNANFEQINGEYTQIKGFADRYHYLDQVYAAYGTFSQSYKKWGYQVGLRAESSFYEGELLDTDSTFSIEYPVVLFPSAFVTYKLNEEDNLQLSFSRRINRPNFFQLIPYPDFSDSLLLSRGNPGLKPEFNNTLEISYQNILNKQHNILASVYYKFASDLITRYQFFEYNEVLQRDALVSTYANSNSSTAYGLELTVKNTFFKMVELTSNLNFYNSIVDATNVEKDLRVEQFTWFAKENLSIRFPQSFVVQFSGSYQSRTAFSTDTRNGHRGWHGGTSNTAQGYTIPVWFVDFSVRKDLWKRKGSITLSVQDIFRSRFTGSHSESAAFIQDTERRRDPQLVRLNFSYRFGKFDVSLFRRKNTRVETEGMDF